MPTAHPVYTKPTRLVQRVARGYIVVAFFAGLTIASVEASSAIETPMQQVHWHLSIGRASLNEALMQLAQQTGVQIARFADVGPTNVWVGPVSGSYTREEALTVLLRDTGLTYRFVNDHTVAIVRVSTPAPSTDNQAPAPASPPTPASTDAGASSANNGTDQGEITVGSVADKTKHQNLLTRLLGALVICGTAQLAPGHACAQETTTSDTLQEVVVTAERRAVDIQTTSVSETAISGADLLDRHVDVIADLETQVPGLSVTNSGFTQNINIRGMGNSTASPTVTTGVPRRPVPARGDSADRALL